MIWFTLSVPGPILHVYPVAFIKVRQSFITKAAGDERLKAIRTRDHRAGQGPCAMDIIAKGIGNPEQMAVFAWPRAASRSKVYWFGRHASREHTQTASRSMRDRTSNASSAAAALLH